MNWLKSEIACEEERRRVLSRRGDEGAQAMAMSQPLTTPEAFAWFGTLLGLFPPAAIFTRAFTSSGSGDARFNIFLFSLAMTVICCAVGRVMGRYLGGRFGNPRDRAWHLTLLSALALGVFWAVVTGAAGGVVVFGIGALVGPVFSVPVALVGFPAFMLLHRLLSRGGMIEERHLWPLAFGVPCVIAAAITSPYLFQ